MRTLLALSLWLSALGLPAAAQSLDDALNDLRTTARVEQALGAHDELRSFDYALRVEDGVLTLGGALPNRTLQQEALTLARATPGVRQVIDSLAVPDPPPADSLPPLPREATPTPVPPTADPPAVAPTSTTYHTVRRGDTLFAIAQQYGVSVADIRRLNNLRSNTINVGQRLQVR